MKKIESFTINHLSLLPGIYVSRRDVTPSGDVITTFDLRLTAPNRENAVSPQAMHTIEHLGATFLRNHPDWASKVVYFGPMGCCTGFYLILQGELNSIDIVDLIKDTFEFIANWEDYIPGATPRDCGNCTFNDLAAAKTIAKRYYEETLSYITSDRLTYPD